MITNRSILERVKDRLRYQVLGLKQHESDLVFGIGLPKTGTTSLCDALDLLGILSIHYPPLVGWDSADDPVFRWPWFMNKFRGFADVTVLIMLPELAQRFPNARYILTTRDKESWMVSCEKHFTKRKYDDARTQKRFEIGVMNNRQFWTVDYFDKDVFSEKYDSWHGMVRSMFSGNTRYIEPEICSENDWGTLCNFLSVPIPNLSFPHSNVGR